MADPVLPGVFRAQVVLQGSSQLPEDRWVTTYAFSGGTPRDVYEALNRLWVGSLTTGDGFPTTGIGRWISPVYDRLLAPAQVRVYDLADPPGEREPILEDGTGPFSFTLPGASGSNAFPAECAIAVTLGNSSVPRRRGRFYIGPLNNATGDVVQNALRVGTTCLQNIRDACAALSAVTATNWGVISQVDGVFFAVDQGHVDDAFDTQRRRGEDPTARLPWPGPE